MIWNMYPYTDFHNMNQDWIISILKAMEKKLEDFVATNSIKYANPFQWSIVNQYEKNTLVIEPNSGTAYLSVQAVPQGVAISNTDYWTPVFDLSQLILGLNDNITGNNENLNVTSSSAYSTGNWLLWKNELYIVISNITPGDVLAPNLNIARTTIEEQVNAISDFINSEMKSIFVAFYDTLDELKTADVATSQSVMTLGYHSVNDNGGTVYKVVNPGDEPSGSYYEVLNNGLYAVLVGVSNTPEMFGAVGDGVNDDSIAFQSCVDHSDVVNLTSGKTYMIDADPDRHPIFLRSSQTINGNGATVKCITNGNTASYIFVLHEIHDVSISDVNFVGDRATHSGSTGEWGEGIRTRSCKNVYVRNCTFTDTWGDGLILEATTDPNENIIIDGCRFFKNRRNGISVIHADGVRITNCSFDRIYGTAPQAGIDLEPNIAAQYCRNVFISDCDFLNCAGAGIECRTANNPSIDINNCRIWYDGLNSDAYTAGTAFVFDGEPSQTGGHVTVNNVYVERVRFNLATISSHTANNYILLIKDITWNERVRTTASADADSLIVINQASGNAGNIIIDNVKTKNISAFKYLVYSRVPVVDSKMYNMLAPDNDVVLYNGVPFDNSCEVFNSKIERYYPDGDSNVTGYIPNVLYVRSNGNRTLTIDSNIPDGVYKVVNVGSGTLTVSGAVSTTISGGTGKTLIKKRNYGMYVC